MTRDLNALRKPQDLGIQAEPLKNSVMEALGGIEQSYGPEAALMCLAAMDEHKVYPGFLRPAFTPAERAASPGNAHDKQELSRVMDDLASSFSGMPDRVEFMDGEEMLSLYARLKDLSRQKKVALELIF